MGRWQPDACGRLQGAAYDLFRERGYDATTVADIAERAGLTKRTFFRHFADKREVLFWGAAALEELFVTAVAEAPASASALGAATAALDAAGAMFEDRREGAAQRQRIIDANPELQERELMKLTTLAAAVAGALRGRGVDDPDATLVAETAILVFRVGFVRWIGDDDAPDLGTVMRETLAELRTVTAD